MENKTEDLLMDFTCYICGTARKEFPWPVEMKKLEGHFLACCKKCALDQMARRVEHITDQAFAKELIKHDLKTLRARMISKKVEYLECGNNGRLFVGNVFGTTDPTGEVDGESGSSGDSAEG